MKDDTMTLPVPNMHNWTDDQVLAVYDLCQMISATLMARRRDGLIDKMIELDQQRGFDSPMLTPQHDLNLQLPFNDPLP
jgi:hypothetical protein